MIDLIIENVRIATLSSDRDFGELHGDSILVQDGKIAEIVPSDQAKALPCNERYDGRGKWILPGLIDCHTHLVYAGNRSDEFEARLNGVSYQEIAANGGGIAKTVRATRAASEEELLDLAQRRLDALASEGVTTVEVKSGYGLDLATEVRMLEVARRLTGATIHPTFLGAHTVPPEYRGQAERYVDLICKEMLPAVRGMATSVDAFCESIAFSPEQVRRVFDAATDLRMKVKLHADQLSDLGGGGLVAEFGGLSADHVEYTNQESVAEMAKAGTVAVLLPGAFYTLKESQKPPVEEFRKQGVPMAVATDHNPGTSPCLSLILMMNMACTLFGLTPLEAVQGVTRNAARALGVLDQIGTIEAGKLADLALYDVEHPRELCSNFGIRPCVMRWRGGKI